jgi:hypothetical protein
MTLVVLALSHISRDKKVTPLLSKASKSLKISITAVPLAQTNSWEMVQEF